MPLTDTKIKNAKPKEKPYQLQDGQGLYLEIRPSGAKFWRYRYWLTPKKDGRYTIGEYPQLSLLEARREREWARGIVKKGISPTDVRRDEKIHNLKDAKNTFEAITKEWLEKKKEIWSEAYYAQVSHFIKINCYSAFGSVPIREINSHDILSVLRTMESRGSYSSALKIRQWCSSIFCYAVSTLRCETDPAAALKGAIIPPKTIHSRCLKQGELIDYFKKIGSYNGHYQTKIALYLMPFIFVRQGELRGAKWEEVNLEDRVWVIPADRMKMSRPHSIPLTETAVRLLKKLKSFCGDNELLFPGIKNPLQPLGSSTINRAIEMMGFGAGNITSHDFRATASTTLYEMGFRREVIEKQLAHSEKNRVVAAYNHAEYFNERREMMEAYEKWLRQFMSDDRLIFSDI